MPKREVRYDIKLAGVWKMKGHCNPSTNNFQRCWDGEKAAHRSEPLTGNTCQEQNPCVSRAARTKEMLLVVSARLCKPLPSSTLRGNSEGLGGLGPLGQRDPCSEEEMCPSRVSRLDVSGWQSAWHLSDAPEPFCSQAAKRSKVTQALRRHLVFNLHVSSPVRSSFFKAPVGPPGHPTDKGQCSGDLQPVKVSFQWVSAAPGAFQNLRQLSNIIREIMQFWK